MSETVKEPSKNARYSLKKYTDMEGTIPGLKRHLRKVKNTVVGKTEEGYVTITEQEFTDALGEPSPDVPKAVKVKAPKAEKPVKAEATASAS